MVFGGKEGLDRFIVENPNYNFLDFCLLVPFSCAYLTLIGGTIGVITAWTWPVTIPLYLLEEKKKQQ